MIGHEEWYAWCAGYGELRDWANRFDPDWLSPAERAERDHWRDASRRRAWIAGRLMAKHLVLACLMGKDRPTAVGTDAPTFFPPTITFPPNAGFTRNPTDRGLGTQDMRAGRAQNSTEDSIRTRREPVPRMAGARWVEILSRDAQGGPTRPRVMIAGQPVPWSLSIAHTATRVYVAVAPACGLAIGVDLAPLGPYGEGFVQTWLTPRERRSLDRAGSHGVATLWALKEAIYKACNIAEPFQPQAIEVLPDLTGWFATYHGIPLEGLAHLRVAAIDGHVAGTVIVDAQQFRRRRDPLVDSMGDSCPTAWGQPSRPLGQAALSPT